jgi:hypothetical protein
MGNRGLFALCRASDHPLGHRRIDHPSRSHEERTGGFVVRVRGEKPGDVGECLRPGAETKRITANHPGAVPCNITLENRGRRPHERRRHEEPDEQAHAIKRRAVIITGCRPGKSRRPAPVREPQSGNCRQHAGRHHEPTRHAVPPPSLSAQARRKLQRTEH